MAFTALCPKCKGSGKITSQKFGNTNSTANDNFIEVPCPDCEGTGVWTPPAPKIIMTCPHCGKAINMSQSLSGATTWSFLNKEGEDIYEQKGK